MKTLWRIHFTTGTYTQVFGPLSEIVVMYRDDEIQRIERV